MQERLARHFLPAEAIILGRTLQTFSLWHWRFLDGIGSPLVDFLPGDFADLSLAARICACAPFAAHPLPRPGWRTALAQRLEMACYGRRLDAHLSAFREYLAHHMRGPKIMEKDEGGGAFIATHPALYLAAGLMKMGWRHHEAWGCAPGLARWYICAAAEIEGRELCIVTDEHIQDALAAGYTHEQMGFGE